MADRESTGWSTRSERPGIFIEIGSDDARTRLPELLRAVQAGHRYTGMRRGKAVADLVPSRVPSRVPSGLLSGVPIAQSRGADTLALVGAMRDFPLVRQVDAQIIRDYITEGSR